jgi:prevent-host-death family protein
METSIDHVGLRELTKHTSSVINRVKEGHEIILTEHGVPVARIAPIKSLAAERLAEAIAKGLATPAENTGPRFQPNPTVVPQGGLVSDLVKDQRA